MRGFLIVIALVLLVQNWQVLSAYVTGGPDYDPAVHGEVVLLTTAWCGYCRKARRFLDASEIPFTEYDVEKTARGRTLLAQAGAHGVPVLLVGDRVVYGFDPAAIRKAFEVPAVPTAPSPAVQSP